MMDIQSLYNLYLNYPVICTNSRTITPGCLFFALKGENFNGNVFAQKALDAGAAYAIIDEAEYTINEHCLLTANVLHTLQQLAVLHRKQLRIPVIGITGTNGKTTTKELIAKVLSSTYRTTATTGNLNNHIGVPLTLLSITKETEIAVVEMGANHPGEIEFLCSLASPTHGIITNIGKAHLEGFGSFEGVIKTKTELYHHLRTNEGTVFVNKDNLILINQLQGNRFITYGSLENNNCRTTFAEADPFVKLFWNTKNETIQFSTHLIGSYNFENISAAICIGNYFKVAPEKIKEAIESYYPSNNRSQVAETASNRLILDMYNANPTSMMAAIGNFSQMKAKNKILILGDMLELGKESEKEHLAIINLLKGKDFKKVILIGPVFQKVNTNKDIPAFRDADEARIYLTGYPIRSATILIKGSRGIKLEKLTDLL